MQFPKKKLWTLISAIESDHIGRFILGVQTQRLRATQSSDAHAIHTRSYTFYEGVVGVVRLTYCRHR